ncbi:hypothetical protein Ate01nite_70390 [Actinoplanes teichomyceticus]|nr:hypothetical protein Ate01nite_70390 [Actinoplanes teichomyceticus]
MTAAVPVCYVVNLESSRRFYGFFGYTEARSGGEGDARWSYLQCAAHALLLACVQPPLIRAELPLLIYLYVDDLAAVRAVLDAAGHPYEPAGRPEHAPGGELRLTDPDGNVVLVGQRGAGASGAGVQPAGPDARFSLLRQAAEAVRRRGGAPATCQIGAPDGSGCTRAAELKLADTWGDTVWGCTLHAEEALISAPSSFIAAEEDDGLGRWLRDRRRA